MAEPEREARPADGRRRRSAASVLVVILVAFVLGALLNAPAMKRTALELPYGGERSFRLALLNPLAAMSHWFFLDRPAKLTAAALDRPDPGPAGDDVVVVVTPSPRPPKKPHAGDANRPLPAPLKGHPMHLYIAGDSMMGLPGMALVNLSRKTRLIKPKLDYRISSGLCRPDFFNWPAQLQQQVKKFNPGAVALMFGANDNQALQTSSGDVYQFESDGWKKEYRRRVRDAILLLLDGGVRRVYWIGLPVMPGATYNRQVKVLNEIYRAEAATHPEVRYIDAYALLSTDGGAYTQYLRDADGDMQQVRETDGEHLTYAGGMRIADAVVHAIKQEWLARRSPAKGGSSREGSGGAKSTH